ncbi:winged-helix domain-containing protein [Methyloferula stellata]|uniref:winged-helix domain-containing protein n=1 Tax=Methyloferula stellata TaxID=876270 RepID=UPI00039DD965|nr:winged-helix domain-containing protein [Methyloferula stellata]
MDTSLDRIRAKIAELEARLDSLKIAERELLELEAPSTKAVSKSKSSTRKARTPRATKAQAIESAAEKAASEEAAPKQTIGAAITDVLAQHGALSASAIAEQVVAAGKDINNRSVSFALQSLKKRGLVKTAGGEWSLKKTRSKRGG